jgi:hypothetical protein
MSRAVLLALVLTACAELPVGNVPTTAVQAMPDPPPPPSPNAPSVQLREPDPPNDGAVRFFALAEKRESKTRFLPGEFVHANVALPKPLAETRGSVSVVVDLTSDKNESLGQCSVPIVGTTKEGAEALVDTTFDVSLLAPAHDDSLVKVACEPDFRKAWARQSASPMQWIRGELRLETVARDEVTFHEERKTLVSGKFLIDLSGGSNAVDAANAKLDAVREQRRREAIPLARMPASKMPTLEPAAMQAIKENIFDTSKTEFVPIRVVITDREWVLERNQTSGVVLRRAINGTAAFRRADKTCFTEDLEFTQEFDGVHYQALETDLPTQPTGDDLLCENVYK